MKFHFEYKPINFRNFVKEQFAKTNLLPYPDYEKDGFKNTLERLRGQVDTQMNVSDVAFQQWMTQLDSRYKQLLPFVYEMMQTDYQRKMTIIEIQKALVQKKVVLAHLLHQCYSENEFTPYWVLISRAYKQNAEIYNKFWTLEIKKAWNEYVNITNNHARFIGDQILTRNNNVEAVLDLYFVRDDHKFYREIFLYIFEHGNADLYKREENRFKEFFKGSDNVTAQRLASGFIKADALDMLEDVTFMIYDRLHTYIKRPMYWSETETKVKERFHQWFLRKNIREFFAGVSQSHERFVYWEKFIPKMKDALVLADRKTILFYFDDVVIMEILDTGAVYVYRVDIFESRYGEKISFYRESLENTERKNFERFGRSYYRLVRDDIRDPDLVYKGGRLTHTQNWQQKFDDYLRHELSWEV